MANEFKNPQMSPIVREPKPVVGRPVPQTGMFSGMPQRPLEGVTIPLPTPRVGGGFGLTSGLREEPVTRPAVDLTGLGAAPTSTPVPETEAVPTVEGQAAGDLRMPAPVASPDVPSPEAMGGAGPTVGPDTPGAIPSFSQTPGGGMVAGWSVPDDPEMVARNAEIASRIQGTPIPRSMVEPQAAATAPAVRRGGGGGSEPRGMSFMDAMQDYQSGRIGTPGYRLISGMLSTQKGARDDTLRELKRIIQRQPAGRNRQAALKALTGWARQQQSPMEMLQGFAQAFGEQGASPRDQLAQAQFAAQQDRTAYQRMRDQVMDERYRQNQMREAQDREARLGMDLSEREFQRRRDEAAERRAEERMGIDRQGAIRAQREYERGLVEEAVGEGNVPIGLERQAPAYVRGYMRQGIDPGEVVGAINEGFARLTDDERDLLGSRGGAPEVAAQRENAQRRLDAIIASLLGAQE